MIYKALFCSIFLVADCVFFFFGFLVYFCQNRAEANQRPFQKPESMSEDEYLGIFSGRMYKRATLIVAPIVLLRQWRREINKFAPM